MGKKDLNRIRHMVEAAVAVLHHIEKKQESDLESDRLLLGGVIRELLLIGEAANAISHEVQQQYPDIPWKQMIGMRNQLIHGYFDINYQIIWNTVTKDIPKLLKHLQKILQSFELTSL